jgi:protein-tyrosine phosphatase
VLSEVGKLLRGPLVIRELAQAPTTEELDQPHWQNVTLVVKEGAATTTNAPPSSATPTVPALTSIVRIQSDGWSAERIGLLNENKLQVSACELIVFVCTGNTCRSPMAEALFRDLLAKRLNCSSLDLTKRGYIVASAGLAADYGVQASPESVEMMRRRGLDLRSHASQPLTDRLLEQSDHCFTLTNQHRNLILSGHPEAADRVRLLAGDGKDISDPIGGGWNHYAACAESIERHLVKVLDELL